MKIGLRIFIVLLVFVSFSHAFNLKDGFSLALENDMDTKVNRNNIKNIEYDKNIADSLLRPKVDFNAKVETTKLTQGQLTPGDVNHTKKDEYELKLTQPIFDGFNSKYEVKLQEQRYLSAKQFLKESENKVALSYTQSYINVLRERDLLSLNKESLEISHQIYLKVNKKLSNGYGTKLEFDEAKGNFTEKKVNLNTQKISFKEAVENLKFYVQADFDSSELMKPTFDYKLPSTLKQAVEVALSRNPSVLVRKVNLEVSNLEAKQSKKNFYPNVDLIGSYKANNALYKQNDSEYNEYRVGFSINYNLYNGGKDVATNKKALQNVKEKKYLIKKSEFEVKNQVRQAWNFYKLSLEKKKSLKQYLSVKKDILDSTIKEFDLGLKDFNSLLDTHVEYIDVKKDLISNTYDLLNSKYRLLSALGLLADDLKDGDSVVSTNTSFYSSLNLTNKYNYDEVDVFNDKKILKITPKNEEFLKSEFKKELNQKHTKVEDDFFGFGDFEEEPLIKKTIQSKPLIAKNISLTKVDSNEEVSFKEKFLTANPNKYTVNLAYTRSAKRAEDMIKKNNISDDAFFFSFGVEGISQKIMYGVFDTKEEAFNAINSLSNELKSNKPRLEKVYIKQDLYKKYHGEFTPTKAYKKEQIVVAKKIVEEKPKLVRNVSFSNVQKEFVKPTNFKEKFLTANPNMYTVNLAYTRSAKGAASMIKRNKITDDAFYFSFGVERISQKIMYGVFESKEEALRAIESLPKELKSNKPRVEKVNIKQNLYKKYHGDSFKTANTRENLV